MQNTNLRKAVIYARYSSHSQRDVSIEQQVNACRRFAELQDIEVVDIYDDRALTGTNDQRPSFQKMVKDAEREDWEYVIVYTLDRFARNRYDSAVYKRKLRDYGVKVLSAMENISDDPTGVLLESLLEGLAEYYSQELSRKIKRGKYDNATKCICNGQIPYGYCRGEDGRFAIDEAEADVVRDIYKRIRDGSRICDVIQDLNDRCLLTKRGQPWTRSSFSKMLSNERYLGIYTYGDIRIPGGMPQIIDQDLFDAVQMVLHVKKNPRKRTALGDRPAPPQRRRQENGIYYLTGKLFCGHCQNPMIGVSGRSRRGPLYFYYTCKGKRTEHTCQKKNVNRDYIEKFIAAALKENMLNDKAIRILADAAVKHQEKKSQTLEIEALENRLTEVRRSLKNLMAAIEAGIFSTTTQARLQELEAEQKLLTTRISVMQSEQEEPMSREEIMAILKMFQAGNIEDESFREALFDTFLVAAYVYDDEVKIVFNLGGKQETADLAFNIDDVEFSETCINDSQLHHTPLYEHNGTIVVMISNFFVFAAKFNGTT